MARRPPRNSRAHQTLATCLLCMVLGACVEKRTEAENIDSFVSATPPKPQHKLDVAFDDKLRIVGYDLNDDIWDPGEEEILTLYWKVDAPLDDGWQLFTHVSDGKDTVALNVDKDGPVRRNLPPSKWKPGTYVRDMLTVTLPAAWASSRAEIYVGVWRGDSRLSITQGAHDDANRARVLKIPVNVNRKPQELPTLRSMKQTTGITLDGKLDEPVWSLADKSDAFVNTMNGKPALPKATVRSAWDSEFAYFAFEVTDDLLKTPFTKHDEHLWKADCVELMIDPGGVGRNYFEIQVSPRNVTFDTRYDTRRVPKPFGHTDWESHTEAKVVAHGAVDDDERDGGYVVEMRIPWSAFHEGEPPYDAPTGGTSWRINFYVMDQQTNRQLAVGWSAPLVGDFHVPPRFGTITFVASTEQVRERMVIDKQLEHVRLGERRVAPLSRDALQALKARSEELSKPRPGEKIPTAESPNP
ncbi:MAG: carbohydrate-binding family 9-like protein [Polyangiales bacterium]